MNAKTLFEMHKLMLGNEVIMTYSGYMSQALLTSIASVLRQQIEQDHLSRKVMRNIFSVFVEQYENVVRYSDDQIEDQGKDDIRYGIMAISKKEGSYILNCGNVIKSKERVNNLRERLESFEGATTEEIAVLMHNLALVIRSNLPGADEPNVADREQVLKHYASTLSTIPFPLLQRAFQHLKKSWRYKTFPKIAEVLDPIKDEMQEIESMYKNLQHLEKVLNVRIHGFRVSS